MSNNDSLDDVADSIGTITHKQDDDTDDRLYDFDQHERDRNDYDGAFDTERSDDEHDYE